MSLHLSECDQETHHDRHLCALADRKQMISLVETIVEWGSYESK
jgi:hypothetical protein